MYISYLLFDRVTRGLQPTGHRRARQRSSASEMDRFSDGESDGTRKRDRTMRSRNKMWCEIIFRIYSRSRSAWQRSIYREAFVAGLKDVTIRNRFSQILFIGSCTSMICVKKCEFSCRWHQCEFSHTNTLRHNIKTRIQNVAVSKTRINDNDTNAMTGDPEEVEKL